MADLVSPKAPDAEPGAVPAGANRWRTAAIAAGLVLLAGVGWFVWRQVKEGAREDRWEELHRIERDAGFSLEDELYGRRWAEPSAQPVDVDQRDAYRRRLEAFLEDHGEDDATAAHVHALLFNVEQIQILALGSTASREALRARYDRAEAHLQAIVERHPEFAMNWDEFKPAGASSVAYLLRAKLKENREWDEQHAVAPRAPDPDVVVLLRTTKGDLKVRLYSKESPALAKAFLDRAVKGDLDGTAFFQSRSDDSGHWLRGGDPRTRKADATDDDKAHWGDATADDPFPYESGRYLLTHAKGTVTAWHDTAETDDDPLQFLLVTEDTPRMNADYSPFAQVDPSSFDTLARIAAVRTRRQETPDIVKDTKTAALQDHLVKPVAIVKALVYEKGELSPRQDASKVRPTEKRLADVVADEDREKEAPPPPVPAMDSPPSMDSPPPMDDVPPMDGASTGGK